MKKTLSKANINNTFAHDRLTLQQVQVHVINLHPIYEQSIHFSGCSVHAFSCHLWDPVYVVTISADPGLNQESHLMFENVMFFKSYF